MIDKAQDPDFAKAVKDFVNEMDASMFRVAGERDFQKEAVALIMEKFTLDKSYKKILTKMARTYHKSNYATQKQDQEAFQKEYEALFGEPRDSDVGDDE